MLISAISVLEHDKGESIGGKMSSEEENWMTAAGKYKII